MSASPAPRPIIVNADDLGMSAAVNAAIFELMERGLVTSATVMANGDAVDEAIRGARHFPKCSFGAHLNVTLGRPVGQGTGLKPLLDETGSLSPSIFAIHTDREVVHGVGEEWCAQIASLRAKGVSISHLDSHQHVHTLPAMFLAFKTAQRRFGIRRARLTKNVYCRELPADSPTLLVKKAVWNAALRTWYRTRTTRRFADLYTIIRSAEEGTLRPGLVEAMVHPGATDDPIMLSELQSLRAGALESLPFQVRLTTYNDS